MDTYVGGLRDALRDFRARAMLILDEAHHAAPAAAARYAVDSQFTRAVRDLAGRFEHRLLAGRPGAAVQQGGIHLALSCQLHHAERDAYARGPAFDDSGPRQGQRCRNVVGLRPLPRHLDVARTREAGEDRARSSLDVDRDRPHALLEHHPASPSAEWKQAEMGQGEHRLRRGAVCDRRGIGRGGPRPRLLLAIQGSQAALLLVRLLLRALARSLGVGRGDCGRGRVTPVEAADVDLKRRREGLGGGKQALLQAGEGETDEPGLARRQDGGAGAQPLAVGGEQPGQAEIGRVLGQAPEPDRLDDPHGEALAEVAQVRLQPAHHHRLKLTRADGNAAGEALRVEDLEQAGEGVRVAVVRRGREEQDSWAPQLFLFSGELGDGGKVYARMFAPGFGIDEDPATGSAAAALAACVASGSEQADCKVALEVTQGVALSRPSRMLASAEKRGGG